MGLQEFKYKEFNKRNVLRAGELIDPAFLREGDDCNFSIAKNRKLISFLQQAVSTFREGHLPAGVILNSFNLNLPSHHVLALPKSSSTTIINSKEKESYRNW